MPHDHSPSTSTAILINPYIAASEPSSSTSALPLSSTPPPIPFVLRYPYPLPLAGVLDLAYTLHHVLSTKTEDAAAWSSLVLSILRGTVLCIVLGCSPRWRSRGGWVGGASGLSVGAVVWEGCQGQLSRAQSLVESGSAGFMSSKAAFLFITAAIAVVEYVCSFHGIEGTADKQLLFLLLLRLSPPPHRAHPFSLRLPRQALQTPTPFAFSAAAEPLSPSLPGPSDRQRYDTWTDDGTVTDADHYDQDEDEDEDFHSEAESDSASENSIIDMPPQASPRTIIPSASMSLGLSAALDGLEGSAIGPLVRRTRSARFLAGGMLGTSQSSSRGYLDPSARGASSVESGTAASSSALAPSTVSAFAISEAGQGRRRPEGYGTFGTTPT